MILHDDTSPSSGGIVSHTHRRVAWLARVLTLLAVIAAWVPQKVLADVVSTTVYVAVPSDKVGTNDVVVNVHFGGEGFGDHWQMFKMSDTGNTYEGSPIYTYTFNAIYGGVQDLGFCLRSGGTNGTESDTSTSSGPEYNGSTSTNYSYYNSEAYTGGTQNAYKTATSIWKNSSEISGQLYAWDGVDDGTLTGPVTLVYDTEYDLVNSTTSETITFSKTTKNTVTLNYQNTSDEGVPVTFKIGEQAYGVSAAQTFTTSGDYGSLVSSTSPNALTLPKGTYTLTITKSGEGYTLAVTGSTTFAFYKSGTTDAIDSKEVTTGNPEFTYDATSDATDPEVYFTIGGTSYGPSASGASITSAGTTNVPLSANSNTLKLTKGWTYTFTVSNDGSAVSVKAVNPNATNYIYIHSKEENAPYVDFWQNSSHSGSASDASTTLGDGWYQVLASYAASSQFAIRKSNSGWNNQTNDLDYDLSNGNSYIFYYYKDDGKWTPIQYHDADMYHIYNGATSGILATLVDASKNEVANKYTITVPTGNTQTITVVGNDGYGLASTSTDRGSSTHDYSLSMGGTGKLTLNGGYNYTVTVNKGSSITVTAEEIGAHKPVYIFGDVIFEGDRWNYNKTKYQFTKDGDDSASIIFKTTGSTNGSIYWEGSIAYVAIYCDGKEYRPSSTVAIGTGQTITAQSNGNSYSITKPNTAYQYVKFTVSGFDDNGHPTRLTYEYLPDPETVYFESNVDNWPGVVSNHKATRDYDSSTGVVTYTYILDLPSRNAYINRDDSKVFFRFEDETPNWGVGASNKDTEITLNASGHGESGTDEATYVENNIAQGNNNFCFKPDFDKYQSYTITATFTPNESKTDGSWKVSVAASGDRRPVYTLTYRGSSNGRVTTSADADGNAVFLIPLDAYNEKSGVTFTITRTDYVGTTAQDAVNFVSTDGNAVSLNNQGNFSFNSGTTTGDPTNATLLVTDDADKPYSSITVTLRNADKTTTADNPHQVDVTYTPKGDGSENEMYLMIRKAGDTDFQKISMSNTRNRDYQFDTDKDGNEFNMERVGTAGDYNYYFYNYNFKYDELTRELGGITNGTTIEWYVMSGGNKPTYYYPAGTTNKAYGDMKQSQSYNNGAGPYDDGGGHYSHYYADDCATGDEAPSHYYTFTYTAPVKDDKLAAQNSDVVSYTFMVGKQYTQKGKDYTVHNPTVSFVYNNPLYASYSGNSGYTGGYSLIGNFNAATSAGTSNVVIYPSKSGNYMVMTRYAFKDNIGYEWGTSIKGESGFTYKYAVYNDAGEQTGTNEGEQYSAWKKFENGATIVPDSIVFMVHVDKPKEADGVTPGHWGNLYIAVARAEEQIKNDASEDVGVWNNGNAIRPQINANWQSSYAYDIDSRALHGGLTTGNRNQSLNPNMSDPGLLSLIGVTSPDQIGSYDFSMNVTTATYRLVFNVAPPEHIILRDLGDVTFYGQKRIVEGRDTKYTGKLNVVATESDGSVKRDADGNDEYEYESDGVTIKTADVTNQPTKYRFFRTWYSKSSYAIPQEAADSIDAFVCTAITAGSDDAPCRVTMTKVPLPLISSTADEYDNVKGDRALYADAPMILAYKCYRDAKSSNFTGQEDYFTSNWTGTTYDGLASGTYNELEIEMHQTKQRYTSSVNRDNRFVGTESAINLPMYVIGDDGTTITGYHYLFGFYARMGYDTKGHFKGALSDDEYYGNAADGWKFDLGYWITSGERQTYTNSCYFELTKDDVGKYYIGTTYNNIGTASAKPALMIRWDLGDFNDNPDTPTGISDVNKNAVNVNDGAWYTLQGIRVTKPSVHGVYIHNGKKVIIK